MVTTNTAGRRLVYTPPPPYNGKPPFVSTPVGISSVAKQLQSTWSRLSQSSVTLSRAVRPAPRRETPVSCQPIAFRPLA
jgi:hypothetical protein